jgi:hypothetical protein
MTGQNFLKPTVLGNWAYHFAPKLSQVVSREPCAIGNDLTLDIQNCVISKRTGSDRERKTMSILGYIFSP